MQKRNDNFWNAILVGLVFMFLIPVMVIAARNAVQPTNCDQFRLSEKNDCLCQKQYGSAWISYKKKIEGTWKTMCYNRNNSNIKDL